MPATKKFEDVFTRVKEIYGLDSSFFQRKLGMDRVTFHSARARGFYPREVEIIDAAFQEIGAAILTTRVPKSSIKEDTRWDRKKERD